MFLDVPIPVEPIEGDRIWVLYQPFLRHRGYELRPRYHPEWTPSWRGKIRKDEFPPLGKYEDDLEIFPATTIDAVRSCDGVKVAIRCTEHLADHEIQILQYLNSPEMRADPRNRTVPVLDILILPDRAFIVMPMLLGFHKIPFRHLGEFSEVAGQLIQGLAFMHEHRIIHRDACTGNILMDPSRVIPGGFHFAFWYTADGKMRRTSWKERWSVRPTNYYFIDFERSVHYALLSPNPAAQYVCINSGITGQDKTVPEFTDGSKFYDGFKLDVYQVGNSLRRAALIYEDFSVFDPLFSAMTYRDPAKRVTAAEAYLIFHKIAGLWSEEQLSARLWVKGTTRWKRFCSRHFHRNNKPELLPRWHHFEELNKN